MKINGSLIKVARESRRYSQKELSEGTGLSQSKLSKAEDGTQGVGEDMIEKIASFLDYPTSFFYEEEDYSPLSHLYFRRKITISAKELNSFLAKVKIAKRMIDRLMAPVELPEARLETYNASVDTPQEIARKTRYNLGIYSGPIKNLCALLESKGILVYFLDFETEKLDGLSTITAGGYKVIFINTLMPNDRIRFSLAHELGHMVMHMDKAPKYEEIVEDQADQFASEFLIPAEEIEKHLSNLDWTKLADLKRQWQVSMRSIIRRAKDLGKMDYDSYRRWQIQFSKKGYNKIEPILLPTESPTILKDVIALYQDELNYSENDMMNLLKLKEVDYQSYFGVVINYRPLFRILRRV